MKHTIKLLTLAFMLATILTLTGCPGPVNNYIEPPVHEHVFGDWSDWEVVTAATCTKDGSKKRTRTCACGKVEEETAVIAALGHDFDDGTVTKEATCTADGEETRTCKREGCTHSETRTIKAHHSWDDGTVTTAATCTTKGSKKHTCTRCGKEETAEIDALGHDYQGGYCEREGCTDPWEHSNIKDIRVYSSEAAFKNDYGSSTSTTNAIRGVPYETLHFSFEKEVSNVKMPLNTLLHLKNRYSGYKVKKYANVGLRITSYNDSTEEVALTNLAALLIEPITNE